MALINKFKVGDSVKAKLFSGTVVSGIIENIEFDDCKDDWVADLSCGHWCYLTQIICKCR